MMYIPRQFREEDQEIILNFIRQNNFGAVITHDGHSFFATHVPMEVVVGSDNRWTVFGHIARPNTQKDTFNDQEALLIFQGAHTYISPRWYGHTNVPTWNYLIVHLQGEIRAVEEDELRKLLSRLVAKHEASSTYRLETLPPDFVEKEIRGATGFAVDIHTIDAAFKLSQNRNDADYQSIQVELNLRGDENSARIARAMRERRNK